MTTSDLVARLTARANLTYSYPIEDILLLRGAADELDRLNAENARLREALEKIIHEDLWSTKHPDGVVQRGQSIFDGYFGGIARAALEGQE